MTSSSTNKPRRVKVPGTYVARVRVPDSTVLLYDDGSVELDGERIGCAWPGQHLHSPRTAPGSRIARYHKTVNDWRADPRGRREPAMLRAVNRQEALQRLIAEHLRHRAHDDSDSTTAD